MGWFDGVGSMGLVRWRRFDGVGSMGWFDGVGSMGWFDPRMEEGWEEDAHPQGVRARWGRDAGVVVWLADRRSIDRPSIDRSAGERAAASVGGGWAPPRRRRRAKQQVLESLPFPSLHFTFSLHLTSLRRGESTSRVTDNNDAWWCHDSRRSAPLADDWGRRERRRRRSLAKQNQKKRAVRATTSSAVSVQSFHFCPELCVRMRPWRVGASVMFDDVCSTAS